MGVPRRRLPRTAQAAIAIAIAIEGINNRSASEVELVEGVDVEALVHRSWLDFIEGPEQ
ncbi:hypothetical protein BN11_40009 [Nostocoides australiense Ben110]|uniref:Uncharacterized protein n=1 Tax=Nostocoides australiense Ben110 TaxID=1193182 RepID=W6JZL7_9MICO|nr:hypothetical protein BN11_40009 [Tetrasphaera australiensis Ben110]